MIPADRRGGHAPRLLVLDAAGGIRELPRAALGSLFRRGDLVVANDAATLPASLGGTHLRSAEPLEIRLAGRLEGGGPGGFIAVVFGAGDHRTPTEDRPPPPELLPGDRLALGPLAAVVERRLDHPRLVALRFAGRWRQILAGIARHGRPIQYAHVPDPLLLWDVWTPVAAHPVAFEAPSAGFALDWATIARWRQRGVGFATLTLAAGISSTGDARLDRRLPFDEPYLIPHPTADALARTRSTGGQVIAIGTTVVRALEAATAPDGTVAAGPGVARGRIGPASSIRVADAILTGVHAPGESHFELIGAFADPGVLDRAARVLERHGYRTHEFGDSVMVHRARAPAGAGAFNRPLRDVCEPVG